MTRGRGEGWPESGRYTAAMPAVLRLLDANANRAREALRVMEDAARFLQNDAELSRDLKQLRHDLAQALKSLGDLQASRDTPGDVGTQITTAAEMARGSAAEVAVAASKRLGEALRSLEEFAKVLPPPAEPSVPTVPARLEQLRYRGYRLEQRLHTAMSHGQARQWRLCLLLTEALCRLPWRDVLDQALTAGVDCVQLREKDLDDAELLERAAYVARRCHGGLGDHPPATCIVNDRPDVALLAGADGVHLGQTDLPAAAVRRLVGHQLLIGVSTSNLAEACAARAAGADYVGLGPMFPTTTKHKPVLAGPAYLREYLADADLAGLPHLAIGGITPDTLPKLVEAGVRGVAVSSVICGAERPQAVADRMIDALSS